MMTHKKLDESIRDTPAARVDLRLQFLGWTRRHLALAVSVDEGRARPISETVVRNMLSGHRPVTALWAARFARALRVPPGSLEPGTGWEPLVQRWFRHPGLDRA